MRRSWPRIPRRTGAETALGGQPSLSRSSLASQVSGYLVACGCVVPVGEGLGHLFVDVPRLATGGGAPAELRAVLLSYALSTVAFALLTPVSNLSLHAGRVSRGGAICLTFAFGAWGAVAALLIPPVLWARTVLNQHTPLELAPGVLIGGEGDVAGI